MSPRFIIVGLKGGEKEMAERIFKKLIEIKKGGGVEAERLARIIEAGAHLIYSPLFSRIAEGVPLILLDSRLMGMSP